MYNTEIQKVLASHEASTPMFLYIAMQDMHGPNQCLEEFMGHYPHTPGSGGPGATPKPGVDNYAVYNGMGFAADQVEPSYITRRYIQYTSALLTALMYCIYRRVGYDRSSPMTGPCCIVILI